jgi:LysR family glycine cleavage system transcriptional activator
LKVTTGKAYYLACQSKSLPAGLAELMDWLEGRAEAQ